MMGWEGLIVMPVHGVLGIKKLPMVFDTGPFSCTVVPLFHNPSLCFDVPLRSIDVRCLLNHVEERSDT